MRGLYFKASEISGLSNLHLVSKNKIILLNAMRQKSRQT